MFPLDYQCSNIWKLVLFFLCLSVSKLFITTDIVSNSGLETIARQIIGSWRPSCFGMTLQAHRDTNVHCHRPDPRILVL